MQGKGRRRLLGGLAGIFVVALAFFAGYQTGRMQPAAGAKRVVAETLPPAFVDDPAVIGKWQSVDFVTRPEDFTPGKQQFREELHLKEIDFLAGGHTQKPFWSWSKGLLYHHDDRSTAHYEIRAVGGADYLFLEWMSGDVLLRGMPPKYYVLRRVAPEAPK